MCFSQVKAISSTAVNLYWNILRNDKYIGGYFIKFRPLHNGHSANYSLVSVRRGLAQTHTLLNLRKYSKYEFVLVPFYKDIKGTASNMMTCQTLQDGMLSLLFPLYFLHALFSFLLFSLSKCSQEEKRQKTVFMLE